MIGAVHRRRWLAVLAVLVMALAAGCTTAAKQEAEVVTRVVSRNGVTLRVPATLRDAVPSCSPPVEDEVEYGIDHSLACPGVIGRPRPPISYVSFADYGPPGGCQPKGDDAIARCLDSSLDPLGRHTGLLVSRTNKVYVEVASRDLGLVRRILQSARTVDQVDGCDVHPARLGATTPSREAAKDQLVPGRPTSVTLCRWYDGVLVTTATLPARQLAAFAPAMNKTRPGLGHAGARSGAPQPGDGRCPLVDSEYVRAHISYASGPPLDLWFRPTGCGRVIGFDNGARTGFLTYAGWAAMTYRVRIHDGIPGALS